MSMRITFKRFLLIFIIPATYLQVAAQSSDTSHNISATFKIRKQLFIQGIVTDSRDHRALSIVEVYMLNDPQPSVLTDSNGAFHIPIPDNYNDFPIKLKFSCLCYKDLKLSIPFDKIAVPLSINMIFSKKKCKTHENPKFL